MYSTNLWHNIYFLLFEWKVNTKNDNNKVIILLHILIIKIIIKVLWVHIIIGSRLIEFVEEQKAIYRLFINHNLILIVVRDPLQQNKVFETKIFIPKNYDFSPKDFLEWKQIVPKSS